MHKQFGPCLDIYDLIKIIIILVVCAWPAWNAGLCWKHPMLARSGRQKVQSLSDGLALIKSLGFVLGDLWIPAVFATGLMDGNRFYDL